METTPPTDRLRVDGRLKRIKNMRFPTKSLFVGCSFSAKKTSFFESKIRQKLVICVDPHFRLSVSVYEINKIIHRRLENNFNNDKVTRQKMK